MNVEIKIRNEFVSDIRNIITTTKSNAVRSIDFERVIMYWKLGERILVEGQQGKERAESWNVKSIRVYTSVY
ncbi:hypothetical protein FACS189426_16360 [Bacteroidia bacterium]|nr:hypothetical protein FACS189426_16360 [Bacteroidia bacterium]